MPVTGVMCRGDPAVSREIYHRYSRLRIEEEVGLFTETLGESDLISGLAHD
jgi:hypothetical protein